MILLAVLVKVSSSSQIILKNAMNQYQLIYSKLA